MDGTQDEFELGVDEGFRIVADRIAHEKIGRSTGEWMYIQEMLQSIVDRIRSERHRAGVRDDLVIEFSQTPKEILQLALGMEPETQI
jgi:hypothetical protein